MPREDWPYDNREHDPRDRDIRSPRDDYGQADYSDRYAYDPHTRSGRPEPRGAEWAYDPERGRPYNRELDRGDAYHRDDARPAGDGDPSGRSWLSRAGDFFAGGGEARAYYDVRGDERDGLATARRAPARQRGPSDRVLFAVISERLETQRRLDLSDVQLHVTDAEVTLEGTVRRKEDRRLIEDLADIDGVRHVQNNLRVREGRGWTFL